LGEDLGEGATAGSLRKDSCEGDKSEGKQKTPSPLQGEGRDEGERGEGRFTPQQLAWLNKIKDQIAQNAEMTVEDFNYIPFNQEGLPAPLRQAGGLLKARELFGKIWIN